MAIFSFKNQQTGKQKKTPALNQAATSSFLRNTGLTQEQRLAAQVLGGQATTSTASTQPAPTTTGPSVNVGGVGGTAPTTAGSTTSTTSGIPTGGFTPPPINPPPTYTEEGGLGVVDLGGTQVGKDLVLPAQDEGLKAVDLGGTQVGKDLAAPKEETLTPVDLSGARTDVGQDQLKDLALEVVNLNEARVGGDTLPAGAQEMSSGFGGGTSLTMDFAPGENPIGLDLYEPPKTYVLGENGPEEGPTSKPSESVTMESDEELDYLRELAMANLKKLYEGGPTAEDRSAYEDTLKEAEKEALAQSQRISDLSAMGLSGAGQQLQADIGRVGERETTMAMDEYDRQARQEEAQRALQAIGLIDPLQQAEFEKLAYEQAKEEMGTRTENPDGSYTVTFPDGSFEKYDKDGKLIAKVGPPQEGYVERPTEPYDVVKRNAVEVDTVPDGAKAVYHGDGWVYYKTKENTYVKVPDRTIRTD